MENSLTFNERTALGFIEKAKSAKNEAGRAWFMSAAHKAAMDAGQTLTEIQAKVAKPNRCAHYKEIKAFFAVARGKGYDTSKASQDRWRGAIGMLLGRSLASRSELTREDWEFCIAALRLGHLFI